MTGDCDTIPAFLPNRIASPSCQPTGTLLSSAREPDSNASLCDVVQSLGPAWPYSGHRERLSSFKCHLMFQILLACLFLGVTKGASSPTTVPLDSFSGHHSGSILTSET